MMLKVAKLKVMHIVSNKRSDIEKSQGPHLFPVVMVDVNII